MGKQHDPFAAALEDLSMDDLRELTGRLLDLNGFNQRPVKASRRRKRRSSPYRLTVRIDLSGAKPPIWRRVELPSTLRLDQVHDLAQALFGWTDSHLHRFALGDSVWGHDAELFLCPGDLDEGETGGVPAATVRLDEVLSEVGDRLLYVYDFGDEWTLTFHVEAVIKGELDVPVVLAGSGSPPPEDVGGIHTWNEHRDDAELDLASLTEAVREASREWHQPARVVEVRRRLRYSPSYEQINDVVEQADLAAPLTEQEAAEGIRQYAWLLDRVGAGIALTQAGYLPPREVLAAMTELGLETEWIGKGNREDQTRPVAGLRRSAQRLGLLRVNKGRLLPTKAGTAALSDAVTLASTVAQKAGGLRRTAFQRELTTLVLLLVAAGRSVDTEDSRRLLVKVLGDLGWSPKGGGSLHLWGLLWEDEDTRELLGALGCSHRLGTPPAGARALARLTLRSLI